MILMCLLKVNKLGTVMIIQTVCLEYEHTDNSIMIALFNFRSYYFV